MTAQLFDPSHRILLTYFEFGELCWPGTRSQAQLETTVGRRGQCDGLLGQHGRMPERIAEHQMADAQPLRPGGDPTGNAHCLPDVFIWLTGGLEVVDEGDAVESGRLGALSPLHNVSDREPHLRQKQIPLDHPTPPFPRGRDCVPLASLLFLLC